MTHADCSSAVCRLFLYSFSLVRESNRDALQIEAVDTFTRARPSPLYPSRDRTCDPQQAAKDASGCHSHRGPQKPAATIPATPTRPYPGPATT